MTDTPQVTEYQLAALAAWVRNGNGYASAEALGITFSAYTERIRALHRTLNVQRNLDAVIALGWLTIPSWIDNRVAPQTHKRHEVNYPPLTEGQLFTGYRGLRRDPSYWAELEARQRLWAAATIEAERERRSVTYED